MSQHKSKFSSTKTRMRKARRKAKLTALALGMLVSPAIGQSKPKPAQQPGKIGSVAQPNGGIPIAAGAGAGNGSGADVEATTADQSGPEATSAAIGTGNFRLRGARLISTVDNGKIVLSGLSGSLGGGQVRAEGRLAMNASDNEPQRVNAKFAEIDVRQALAAFGLHGQAEVVPSVRASGAADASWRGSELAQMGNTVSGGAVLAIGAGQIDESSPYFEKLRQVTGLRNIRSLAFSSGRVELVAKNGSVHIKSATLIGPQFTLALAGDVDLRESNMAVALDVRVTPELAQQSSWAKIQNVRALFGGAAVKPESDGLVRVPRLVVQGAFSDPKVSVEGPTVAVAGVEDVLPEPVRGQRAATAMNVSGGTSERSVAFAVDRNGDVKRR